MKKTSLWRLLKYIIKYKRLVALNILCNLLMAIFMVISIPTLIPFLNILFNPDKIQNAPPSESTNLISKAEYYFSQSIQTYGKDKVLIYSCLLIVLVCIPILVLIFYCPCTKWRSARYSSVAFQ
jgi:ATP-binding cassette, subfamily B, bacterial MsbA